MSAAGVNVAPPNVNDPFGKCFCVPATRSPSCVCKLALVIGLLMTVFSFPRAIPDPQTSWHPCPGAPLVALWCVKPLERAKTDRGMCRFLIFFVLPEEARVLPREAPALPREACGLPLEASGLPGEACRLHREAWGLPLRA